VAIFIDGSNFYHGVRSSFGKLKVDFERFLRHLQGGRKIVRAYYYITSIPESKNKEESRKQRSFFSYLSNVPYLEIKYGRLEERFSQCNLCNQKSKHWVEKGVDVFLAVDMVRMAYQHSYDTAILVSGDGDFSVAVKTVKDTGKHVELAYFNPGWARQLNKECDKFVKITREFLTDK